MQLIKFQNVPKQDTIFEKVALASFVISHFQLGLIEVKNFHNPKSG